VDGGGWDFRTAVQNTLDARRRVAAEPSIGPTLGAGRTGVNIGILGAGNIGATVAGLLGKAGHDVRIASTHDPAALEEKARGLGERVHAATPQDAVAFGDVVLLAVPWPRKEDAIPDAGPYDDKIVIDAMNPYTEDFEVEDLGDRTSSEITQTLVPGARLVKAFNTLHFRRLKEDGKPKGSRGRLVIFLAGDDAGAKNVVGQLIDEVGFEPVDTGSLSEGGRKQQPGSPIYNTELAKTEAVELLKGLARR
jgi:predicted dinucleotide-binding enzyme